MGRYKAEEILKEGFSIIVLTDSISGALAEINPDLGNNLIRFEKGGHQIITPPERLQSFKEEKSTNFKFGTPILSPPNRIKNGQYTFNGQEYTLPLNEPPHHHLHGELSTRAWEVLEFGASEESGAFVKSRFRYESHPDITAYFPHPLTFTFTYKLCDGSIELRGSITNEGTSEAPFSLGLHPYFQVPFGSGEDIILHVPAIEEWPVTNLAFVKDKPSITQFSQELKKGVNIADYPELGCSLLSLHSDDRTCRIEMPDRQYTIVYQLDTNFPFLLLFRPDWSSAFSLEPYTYVTDAFNLPYEYEFTGAKGIKAGEEIQFITKLWIEQ